MDMLDFKICGGNPHLVGPLQPGENPYIYYQRLLLHNVYPDPHRAVYPVLMIFSVWRGIVILAGLYIILIPIKGDNRTRRKHLWLIRKKKLHPDYTQTYWVPNRALFVAGLEIVSSILYQIFIYLNIRGFMHASYASHHHVALWYGLPWLPSYVGTWIAGWGLCSACLVCKSGGRSENPSSTYLSPALYNWLWTIWPVLVVFVNIHWAVAIGKSTNNVTSGVENLSMRLQDLADIWDADHKDTRLQIVEILQDLAFIKDSYNHLTKSFQGWCWSWIVFGIILAVFYISTTRYLLSLIHKLLEYCDETTYTANWTDKHQPTDAHPDETHSTPTFKFRFNTLVRLKTEFVVLMRSSTLISLAILFQISNSIFQYFTCQRLCSPKWRVLAAIFCLLPSTFTSPALLLQAWQLFSDQHSYEDSDEGFDDSNLVSRLTFSCFPDWWHTDEESCMISAPFTSLDNAPVECSKSAKTSKMKTNKIQVTRLTVIEVEDFKPRLSVESLSIKLSPQKQ